MCNAIWIFNTVMWNYLNNNNVLVNKCKTHLIYYVHVSHVYDADLMYHSLVKYTILNLESWILYLGIDYFPNLWYMYRDAPAIALNFYLYVVYGLYTILHSGGPRVFFVNIIFSYPIDHNILIFFGTLQLKKIN